jgi:hypothetical protein
MVPARKHRRCVASHRPACLRRSPAGKRRDPSPRRLLTAICILTGAVLGAVPVVVAHYWSRIARVHTHPPSRARHGHSCASKLASGPADRDRRRNGRRRRRRTRNSVDRPRALSAGIRPKARRYERSRVGGAANRRVSPDRAPPVPAPRRRRRGRVPRVPGANMGQGTRLPSGEPLTVVTHAAGGRS